MFLHAFCSWLLSLVVLPILILIGGLIIDPASVAEESFSVVFPIIFISAAITIPGLVIAWLFLGIVIYSDYTPTVKFLFWLIVTGLGVVLNALIVVLLFNLNIDFWENVIGFTVLGVASIWISCVIRIRYFFELNRIQNMVIN